MTLKLFRIPNGYVLEESEFTFNMHYNLEGVYIGQEQDDVQGYGTLYFRPEIIDGQPYVNSKAVPPLTKEEMAKADSDFVEIRNNSNPS